MSGGESLIKMSKIEDDEHRFGAKKDFFQWYFNQEMSYKHFPIFLEQQLGQLS